jgi:4a-hydroxytetrahydrobiopterin dehydratase
MKYQRVSASAIAAEPGLEHWRFLLGMIRATYRTGSFPAATALAMRVADAAEAAVHHPDIDVRYPDRVIVTLTTHEVQGVTDADVAMARTISSLAAATGAVHEPGVDVAFELGIDAIDAAAIKPFWRAVLAYVDSPDGALVDPLRLGPRVWFQQMDAPRPQRNRIHVDVSVAHDVAEARVAEALAAGGVMVNESFARAFWVLADAEGNEACVCTWMDRDD